MAGNVEAEEDVIVSLALLNVLKSILKSEDTYMLNTESKRNMVKTDFSHILLLVMLVVLFLAIAFSLIYSIYLSEQAEKICERKCIDKGALSYSVKANGEYNINDLCTCFGSDWTSTFRI